MVGNQVRGGSFAVAATTGVQRQIPHPEHPGHEIHAAAPFVGRDKVTFERPVDLLDVVNAARPIPLALLNVDGDAFHGLETTSNFLVAPVTVAPMSGVV